ncbi:MAG: hypothetical protein HYY67_07440 [Thaumarchaeota archaeon]|nr:hypothetical protein [Nitrososphaerota archaeon]
MVLLSTLTSRGTTETLLQSHAKAHHIRTRTGEDTGYPSRRVKKHGLTDAQIADVLERLDLN